MKLTADISMYPPTADFIPPIDAFIEKINCYPAIKVETFPTSTVVIGDFQMVMNAVQETIAYCTERFGMAIYVVKYLPDYVAI